MAQVANVVEANRQAHHTKRRLDAQVDALLKAKCGDLYNPPEADEMGHIFLNSPIIGSEAINQIADVIDDEAGDSEVQFRPGPPPGQFPSLSGILKKMLMWALPLLLTSLVTLAIAWYFMPSDTDTQNEFDIEAIPFVIPGDK